MFLPVEETPRERACAMLDGMIATTTEGFATVAEQAVLRPEDEPLQRAFSETLVQLDRLLALREKLCGVTPGPQG